MLEAIAAKEVWLAISIELIVCAIYALFAVTTYSETELSFTEDDMQLRDVAGNLHGGAFGCFPYGDESSNYSGISVTKGHLLCGSLI